MLRRNIVCTISRPPEELHQPYRFCHAGASPRLVDQAHRFVQRRIELEDVVVHLQQCAAHIVTADHRRVAQHRHLCRRTQLVAYGDRVGDDLLELRVHRRFSVAREGNHVGRRSCGGHLPQFRAQQRPHLFARVETGLEAMFAPAAFAVDAVEVAKFVVGGQQVHPERQSESAAVHGTEDDAVEKEWCSWLRVGLFVCRAAYGPGSLRPVRFLWDTSVRYLSRCRAPLKDTKSCRKAQGVGIAVCSGRICSRLRGPGGFYASCCISIRCA